MCIFSSWVGFVFVMLTSMKLKAVEIGVLLDDGCDLLVIKFGFETIRRGCVELKCAP